MVIGSAKFLVNEDELFSDVGTFNYKCTAEFNLIITNISENTAFKAEKLKDLNLNRFSKLQ